MASKLVIEPIFEAHFCEHSYGSRPQRSAHEAVAESQRRLEGFDEKVLALYARGLCNREIQAQLEYLYDVEVSPALQLGASANATRGWFMRPTTWAP